MVNLRAIAYAGTVLCALMGAPQCGLADSVDEQIRSTMRANQVPGAVIEVLQAGKVLKLAAYGVADVELNVPSSTQNVYPLASVTKVLTSTAVLLLVQDGTLQLEQPVGNVVPNLPSAWRPLTVRQCLTHTTGLPDIYEDDSPVPIAWDLPGLFAKLQGRPLGYQPGSQSRYEQTDYVLLRLVVEQVAKVTIQEFIGQRILRPLGMTTAKYGDSRDVVPGRVAFYWRYAPAPDRMHILLANGQAVPSPDKIWSNFLLYPSYNTGGVGLNMSVGDLGKFDTALWSGALLRPDLLEEMVKPIVLPDGTQASFTLAWEIDPQHGGDRVVYYTGAGAIVYAHDRDTGVTVIVMTNCNGGQPSKIVQALFDRFSPHARL